MHSDTTAPVAETTTPPTRQDKAVKSRNSDQRIAWVILSWRVRKWLETARATD